MRITFDLAAQHKQALTALVQSGTLPAEYQGLMADLAGAINAAWDAGTAPAPAPTPDPADALARIRAAPSQWAKLWFADDREWQALIDRGFMSQADSNVLKNWWQLNGVKGYRQGNAYLYSDYSSGSETVHQDGTDGNADAATTAASGKPIPGPLV